MVLITVLVEKLQCNWKVWGRFAPSFFVCTKYLEIAEKTATINVILGMLMKKFDRIFMNTKNALKMAEMAVKIDCALYCIYK